MGPKKQIKKQVVQQVTKQQQPQIPQHELHGYGKFEYLNGVVYQGNWRLFNQIKLKHGTGTLTTSTQSYTGSWSSDKMQGYGTYKYACGSIYKGQWKNNKQHGSGVYQFANGTIYQGQWKDHQMHGTGYFIGVDGRKWHGQYRQGKFQTRRQKQLIHQKQLQKKKVQSKTTVLSTIATMLEVLAKSDKKTFKQNFSPYFAAGQTIKQQVKQPYSKFDQRPQQKWVDLLNFVKNGKVNVLINAASSLFLGEDRIIAAQLEGPGQIVEVINQTQQRTSKVAFVNVQGNIWILMSVSDEQKKK